jgi:hypothetical protein
MTTEEDNEHMNSTYHRCGNANVGRCRLGDISDRVKWHVALVCV